MLEVTILIIIILVSFMAGASFGSFVDNSKGRIKTLLSHLADSDDKYTRYMIRKEIERIL